MKRNVLLAIALSLMVLVSTQAQGKQAPNVLLIITDDQGYGDLGCTGNPHVKTPVIDQLAGESVRLTNFYVSPVCAPTRSSLMTGRYSLRTGVRDTYNGGAIMATSEVTIAEMLKKENYATGIFGKWHLGDNYPSRPSDQGFDESLIHLSGGMGQVGDITTYFQGDSSYFNPVLWHNNEKRKFNGYCSDIFTDQAIRFIQNNRHSRFFCYLSFNAPHTPLQVPDKYYQMYENMDPSEGFKPDIDLPEMSEKDKEDALKVYAMVSNIDDNIGRILKQLEDLKLSENTLVIFMTDNGPQQRRYVAGMRGRKGHVYNGGVRVPCFMRYPAILKGNCDVSATTVHMDMLPTLANLCGATMPDDRPIDGKDLTPLLQKSKADWDYQRTLFFYWTRKYPELYNNIALMRGQYKLVGHTSYDASITDFELFNLVQDPFETNNLVDKNTTLANELKQSMDSYLQELLQSPNIQNQPPIIIGSKHENPTFLNRNDASGDRGIWAQDNIFGKWRVKVLEGSYTLKFRFLKPVQPGSKLVVEIANRTLYMPVNEETTEIVMEQVQLPSFEGDLIPFCQSKGKRILPFWVEAEFLP
jgi:arylsulfatase